MQAWSRIWRSISCHVCTRTSRTHFSCSIFCNWNTWSCISSWICERRYPTQRQRILIQYQRLLRRQPFRWGPGVQHLEQFGRREGRRIGEEWRWRRLQDLHNSQIWKNIGSTLEILHLVLSCGGKQVMHKIEKHCRRLETIDIEGNNLDTTAYSKCISSYAEQLKFVTIQRMEPEALQNVVEICTNARFNLELFGVFYSGMYHYLKIKVLFAIRRFLATASAPIMTAGCCSARTCEYRKRRPARQRLW